MADAAQRNFYGRRKGKGLKRSHERYLAEDLPRLSIPGADPQDNPERALIDPAALYGDGRPLWLEIGFGAGEHLAHQARANPGIGFIGAEPFINGVATLLGKLRGDDPGNVRVHAGDVRDLFDVLPEGCIERAFLLYPDPWPKARHHRRRFVTPEHLAPLARVMRSGAELRVATDIADYVRQTLEEVPPAGFALRTPDPADRHTPWPDWHRTRYEAKALREGRVPHYLIFARA